MISGYKTISFFRNFISLRHKSEPSYETLSLQIFTAAVATGSSVMYTWVINNLVHSAHIGEAYSVAFTKPAEHTLRVNTNKQNQLKTF